MVECAACDGTGFKDYMGFSMEPCSNHITSKQYSDAQERHNLTPADLRAAREALGMTQSGLAKALRLSPKNGDRTVRLWETEGNTVPGPVQVAVECFLLSEKLRSGSVEPKSHDAGDRKNG